MNHQPTPGSKLGIDATKKWIANPESFRGWPPLIKMDESVKAKVEKRPCSSERQFALTS